MEFSLDHKRIMIIHGFLILFCVNGVINSPRNSLNVHQRFKYLHHQPHFVKETDDDFMMIEEFSESKREAAHSRNHQTVSSQLPYFNPNRIKQQFAKIQIPDGRPIPTKRLFVNQKVEDTIQLVSSQIRDDALRQIFINCFPNTLDTTVFLHEIRNGSVPYSYIITGDIRAMWLRDSTYQVNPYIQLAGDDSALQNLVLGVINTQAEMINLYPFGNAYFPLKHWNSSIDIGESEYTENDQVKPKYDEKEVWEAKFELDSLSSFLYLTKHYWEETGDTRFLLNKNWLHAIYTILHTFRKLQAGTIEVFNDEPYTFTRPTRTQTETQNLYGIGNPVKRCGLIRSFFRPSDDSTIFQYLIPSNAMAVVGLNGIAKIFDQLGIQYELSKELKILAKEILDGIYNHGLVKHPIFGDVFAFEVDCYGSSLFMDDGNFPSLLSLPFYGFVERNDPIYLNTRKYILSANWNPYYTEGIFSGIGSPHTGLKKVWHLAQSMQAFTSTDEAEIIQLLEILRCSTGDTGFMHESYDPNNPYSFTRSWFAWANTFFGDLILYLYKNYPHLLQIQFSN